jgi:hypothetical protein
MEWMAMFRIIAVLFAMVAASGAQARDLHAFLSQLQRASQSDDRKAVAGMVRYPVTISIGGLRVPIPDAATFLNRYDDIFNPALREQIARAGISEGKLAGATDISIRETDGIFQITGITVPTYADPPAPVGGPSAPERKQEPRRVSIRVGPRPTQISGLLAGDAIDTFLVFIPKGMLAGVRLERVPVGSAAIRVVHARTGAPLSARPSADDRFVSGRPSEDGEYRIEVRRLGAGDDAHLPYLLSLTLR